MRLWLGLKAREALVAEATRMTPRETGGVLMGYRGEGGDLVVTAVLGPGPAALHAPTRFVPDQAHHEREIARLYEASGRMHTYVGDWHSHPNGTCALSPRDRSTLRRIGRAREARLAEPLMVLVCGRGTSWEIAGYRLVRDRMWPRIVAMTPVAFS